MGAKDEDLPDSGAALNCQRLLVASAETASRREPPVIVGTMLLRGDAREWLVDITRTAAMLVLGTELGALLSSRRFDGLTHRLTSSGHCHVVTVSRTPQIYNTGLDQILAVWTSETGRADVLFAAAEEAFLRKAGLTLALPGSGPEVSLSETEVADEDSVARDLVHLASRYSGLQVTIDQIDPKSVASAELADGFRRQATCPLLFPSDHVDGSWRAP